MVANYFKTELAVVEAVTVRNDTDMFKNMLAVYGAAVTSSLSPDATMGVLRSLGEVLGAYIDREYVLLTEDLLVTTSALRSG